MLHLITVHLRDITGMAPQNCCEKGRCHQGCCGAILQLLGHTLLAMLWPLTLLRDIRSTGVHDLLVVPERWPLANGALCFSLELTQEVQYHMSTKRPPTNKGDS